MSYGAGKYKNTAVLTASPEKILLMLYEGAIKACKLAKVYMEKKNVSEKCRQISKAHDIILELRTTLDRSKGPELADRLAGLYDWSIKQLLVANMQNDTKALDNVIKILETLYEGWVVAVEEFQKQKKKDEGVGGSNP